MYTNIDQRACDVAVYIIENRSIVRQAASQFGISKSTAYYLGSEVAQEVRKTRRYVFAGVT